MRSTPAVSVVIPAYNVTAYIAEAVESVLAQTFKDFEAIVVNDGCPDTENLERALAPYRSRMVYLKQANGGPAAARNTGVQHARAPVIALLDADDAYLPEYLECQMGILSADPALTLVYPNMFSHSSGPFAGRLVMDGVPSVGEATFEALVEQRCQVLNCATIRREAILRAGLWDPSLRHAEDYDLWLRIAFQGDRIGYHRRPLARVRARGDSQSSDPVMMCAGQLYVYEKLQRILPLSDRQRRLIGRMVERTRASQNFHLGKQAFVRGEFSVARDKLAEANRVFKRRKLSAAVALLRIAPRALRALYRLRTRWLEPPEVDWRVGTDR